jgi:hypothetical protein
MTTLQNANNKCEFCGAQTRNITMIPVGLIYAVWFRVCKKCESRKSSAMHDSAYKLHYKD